MFVILFFLILSLFFIVVCSNEFNFNAPFLHRVHVVSETHFYMLHHHVFLGTNLYDEFTFTKMLIKSPYWKSHEGHKMDY